MEQTQGTMGSSLALKTNVTDKILLISKKLRKLTQDIELHFMQVNPISNGKFVKDIPLVTANSYSSDNDDEEEEYYENNQDL